MAKLMFQQDVWERAEEFQATHDFIIEKPSHIEKLELEQYFTDESWVMQEKIDGQRLFVGYDGEREIAWSGGKDINTVIVPECMRGLGKKIGKTFLVDCESVGGARNWGGVVIFNVLMFDSVPFSAKSVDERLSINKTVFGPHADHVGPYMPAEVVGLNVLTGVVDEEQKRKMFQWLKEQLPRREGVIFRKRGEAMKPGRSNSDIRRFVFKATLDVFVTEYSPPSGVIDPASRGGSFQAAVMHNGRPVGVGKIKTGLDNEEHDEVVAMVQEGRMPVFEVRILLARTVGANLVQPSILRMRDDKNWRACQSEQFMELFGEDRRSGFDAKKTILLNPGYVCDFRQTVDY